LLAGQLVPIASFYPDKYIRPVAFFKCSCFFPNFFHKLTLIIVFLKDRRVILLSVFNVNVLGVFSLIGDFSIVSNALNIASCSAWLLDHISSSVNVN